MALGAKAQSGTSFTYQGSLNSTGGAVNGPADLRFRLYDAAVAGNVIGTPLAATVQVNQGVFTVGLDFGSAFDAGLVRWLEIDVRAPAGSGSYVTLAPRQPLGSAPLALGLSGIATTRAGVQSVDQNQFDGYWSGGTTDRLDLTPTWETFTAGKTGALTRLDMDGYGLVGSYRTLTVNLHLGAGVSGPVLGTATVSVKPGQSGAFSLAFPNVTVNAGQQYTIEPQGLIFLILSSGDIAGASAGPTSANRFVFRTYVTPDASIGAKASKAVFADAAGTVNWSGIAAVPSTLSGPLAWNAVSGGIAFTGGNVGIGTPSPQAPLHVSGNSLVTGRLGVGTTTPLVPLHVKGNAGMFNLEGTDHAYIQYYPLGYGNGRKAYIGIPSAGSNGLTVAYEGTGGVLSLVGNVVQVIGSFVNNSDEREKHDVRDIQDPLDLVARLRGVRFHWNDHGLGGEPLPAGDQMGFLAQEVERVLPDLVHTDPSGRKAVSYISLVPLLTEAVKVQQKNFDAKLDEKQREIDDLKARLDRLERAMALGR